jgi:hypothetical protein
MSQGRAETGWLNQAVAELLRKFGDLLARVKRLEQLAWTLGAGGGGGGGGTSVYFSALSTSLGPASGLPPSGVPNVLSGQTVYLITGGAYSSVTTAGDIVNASPTGTLAASPKLTFLAPNGDGSYSAIGQTC